MSTGEAATPAKKKTVTPQSVTKASLEASDPTMSINAIQNPTERGGPTDPNVTLGNGGAVEKQPYTNFSFYNPGKTIDKYTPEELKQLVQNGDPFKVTKTHGGGGFETIGPGSTVWDEVAGSITPTAPDNLTSKIQDRLENPVTLADAAKSSSGYQASQTAAIEAEKKKKRAFGFSNMLLTGAFGISDKATTTGSKSLLGQ